MKPYYLALTCREERREFETAEAALAAAVRQAAISKGSVKVVADGAVYVVVASAGPA